MQETTRVAACGIVLASAAWLSGAYFGVEEPFTHLDRLTVFGVSALALALQVAILDVVSSRITSKWQLPALSGLFLAFNVFALNLVMNEWFVGQQTYMQVIVLAGAAALGTMTINMTLESPVLRNLIWAGLVLLALQPAALWVLGKQQVPGVDLPHRIAPATFASKPSVYLIGFESMAAPSVLAQTMQYVDSPLPDAFQRNDFRVFKNLFTEVGPTRNSIRAILSLDLEFRRAALALDETLLNGDLPAPLLKIFGDNGYEISTGYYNSYFGAKAGPNVDHYRFQELLSICALMTPQERNFAFFGACRLLGWKVTYPSSATDFYMDYLREVASRRQRPQFMFIHMPPLLHTRKEFGWDEEETRAFRAEYHDQGKSAAMNLDRIMSIIRENDKDALVFVFGDHGVILSRRFAYDNQDQRRLFVLDRYAVLGGVSPAAACDDSFSKPMTRSYTTTVEVVRMVIRCLNGGVDVFPEGYVHQLQTSGKLVNLDEFTYE